MTDGAPFDRTRSAQPRPGRRWWCAAVLVAAWLALTGVWAAVSVIGPAARHRLAAPATPRATAPATRSHGLSRLSMQAQAMISSTVSAGDARFAPTPRAGGFGLAGGRVAAALGPGGISVRGGGTRLSLALTAVGRGPRRHPPAEVTPQARSHRVVYQRGRGLLEWYSAGPLGVEQGFSLARRPAGGSGPVTLALAVEGLRARRRGSEVQFLARSGRVALRYGGLVARDARGRRLPAWLSVSRSRLLLGVSDRGARYPLLIDPFIQQGPKLTASDETGKAGFGTSVAVSADGNTALVGGPTDDINSGSCFPSCRGAAWVFTRSGGTWSQQGPKLTPNDAASPPLFGTGVALSADGNTALIGGDDDNAVGAAWVFTRSGSTWTQQGPKLTSTAAGTFGQSVALSGDGNTALIGAPNDNNNLGTAWVFTRSNNSWTQQGSALTGSAENGQSTFGGSLALSEDGNTALIGGLADNNFVGAAWAFTRSGSTWTQLGSKLTASDESGDGGFGGSVALSGDGRTALIGASNDGTGGTIGAAWVFTRNGQTFTQRGGKLEATDESGQGNFGSSVALSQDGSTALIGGVGDNGAVGAAWLFAVGTATQQGPKLTASDANGQANLGASVALSADGSTALVGGNGDNNQVGAAWAFAAKNPTVYWDNGQAGSIGRDTGPPSQVDQFFITGITQNRRIGVAADAQHLYWTAGGFIARANLDGSSVNQQFIQIAGPAMSVAVDAQHIYWTSGNGVGRANLDGSGADDHFITVAGSLLSGLAVSSSQIYWKDSTHGRIGSANLDGTGVNQSFIGGTGTSVGGVAVDSQHIYWTRIVGGTRPFGGTIGRANLDATGIDQNFITGASEPSGVAVDSGHVYWANYFDCDFQNNPVTTCAGGKVGRANLDGTSVDQSFATADQGSGVGCGTSPQIRCGPSSVAVATLPDGSAALYWDNPQIGDIGRETIDGNAGNVNQSVVTGIQQLRRFGVAVDRQHVYWSDGGFIGRANLDGTGVNRQLIHLAAGSQFVAVDDQHVYWTAGNSIGRANLDGSGVNDHFITVTGGLLAGLAVDSFHIYWADTFQNSIGRANLDGTGVDQRFIAGSGTSVKGVAVDGQHVYWTQSDAGSPPTTGSIGRANLDGTGLNSSFVTGAPEPVGIAVDFDHIYWANSFDCDFHTFPPSACAGGTIGRANLDGSAVNQSFATADQSAGPNCGTSPEIRCGPSSVAVGAPTQPACLRTSPTPEPPPGGAVFAQPLNPASPGANVVVLPAGTSWTGPSSCSGISQGSDAVMTDPASVSVSPDAAVLLRDQPAGLFSAWGAQDAGPGNPAPVLFPGRSDWQTTEADMIAPQQLLDTYNGCPVCVLPSNITFTPGLPSADVAYQHDVHDAVLDGANLTGSFGGWNFTGAQLPGATLGGASSATDISGTTFDGADLRGAQLTSLTSTTPPSLANVRVGALNGACTQFTDTNLVNAGLTPVKADLLVPGCGSTPLLPQSTVPLDLLNLMTVTDGATIDYANANFLVTAVNDTVLEGADLSGIELDNANFLGFPANLEGTQFNHASLQGTSFQLADLANAQFLSAVAPGAIFEDANLNSATFAQEATNSPVTNLAGADFIEADITGATFQSADLTNAKFNEALASGTDFNSVVATSARFVGAHIYGDGTAFQSATALTNADFSDAVLAGSDSSGSKFDLTSANLTGAHFDNAQCIACDFSSSTLTNVAFDNAFLPGAQLSDALTLQNVTFSGAWLFCGPSDALCGQPGNLAWPLALGSQEDFAASGVPFTSTTVTQSQLANIGDCPDGSNPAAANPGCTGHLFPGGKLVLPAPCSAVALDACTTLTSSVNDVTSAPISVVPAIPPTWSVPTTVKGQGFYVGFNDGTVQQVSSNSSSSTVAHSPDPAGLAIGIDGSLYIADPTLHQVTRVDPSGTTTTVAGSGTACTNPTATCGDGGQATAASLSGPSGVWVDPRGEVFIADGVRGIREVLPDGTITSVGPKTGAYDVVSIVGDATGNLYAATNIVTSGTAPTNNADYVIQVNLGSGAVTNVVGTGMSGFNGEHDPSGVEINHPGGLSVGLNGDIVFADTGNNLIRAFVPSSGNVIELGGLITNGVPQGGNNGENLFANATKFLSPAAVTVTRGALMVVADTGNSLLREIGPNPLPSQLGAGGPPPPPPGPATGPGPKPPVTTPSHPNPHRRLKHLGAPRPVSRFTVVKIRTHRDGTITFSVTVSGPGTIDVLATAWNNNLARAAARLQPAPHRFAYGRAHARARRAITVDIHLRPNARGRRLVRHHTYRVTLRLWVTYTRSGGRPRSIGFHGLHIPT